MDSDWCIVCDKHLNSLGGLYCSEICRRKEQQSSTVPVKFSNPSYVSKDLLSREQFPYTIKLHKRSTCYRPLFPKHYPPVRTLSRRISRRFCSTSFKDKTLVKC
ncbi:hypothetical protein K493DRAFT_41399 [Basidiobolus meristosporus CBS 931.73]|uniref:Uncharacterized protein n=1 Tax=Basidiobolus meristosporus CBS 931.73 TaxID=1314790 RepID=A0A1Y1Y3X8_9FUNG|nr:hypothetical protein K493DRAFT_41399 [Basidiobolus meristosporus CBS 931.73]|eukprot:ORX92720.1 hypothetical protein K493DRAFT_41399 [Basidiobolus meristosporus CBS 931.73]